MKEENRNADPEGTPEEGAILAGKFKSVEALVRAYGELEAEFTRRSQRLKALEEQLSSKEEEASHAPCGQEELLRAVTQNEGVRARVVSDYLQSLKGVPLMGAGGSNVPAPAKRPGTIREAGSLALGFLKNQGK